jgi:ketosteroid isomerase-like protein
MEESDALRETNARFYRALEALDLDAMDELWLHEPWVRCVHPGWDVLVGWESVRQSFQQIFASTRWMRVTATGVEVLAFGGVGIVSCSENITAKNEDDVGLAVAHATNIYLFSGDSWRLFHHHASPAPVQVTQPFSGTVQ